MTRRSVRRRGTNQTGEFPDVADRSTFATSVTWDDLAEEERTVLKRMNRGPYDGVPPEMAERLTTLGLAVRRDDGIGISRLGRELVIARLLHGRTEQP